LVYLALPSGAQPAGAARHIERLQRFRDGHGSRGVERDVIDVIQVGLYMSGARRAYSRVAGVE
jgi:hypothetical protein